MLEALDFELSAASALPGVIPELLANRQSKSVGVEKEWGRRWIQEKPIPSPRDPATPRSGRRSLYFPVCNLVRVGPIQRAATDGTADENELGTVYGSSRARRTRHEGICPGYGRYGALATENRKNMTTRGARGRTGFSTAILKTEKSDAALGEFSVRRSVLEDLERAARRRKKSRPSSI